MIRHKFVFLSLCAALAFQAAAYASEEGGEQPSRFRVLNFGITERMMTQSRMSGINLSTLLTWNPHYQIYPWLNLEGQLGGTVMSATSGNFVATRYQLGASFHNLLPSLFKQEDRIVPEVLLGAETWAVALGGTYFVGSLNIHYRFHFESMGLLNALDAVHLGWQALLNAPGSAQQYTVGIRIIPFPEKRIESTHQESLKPTKEEVK